MIRFYSLRREGYQMIPQDRKGAKKEPTTDSLSDAKEEANENFSLKERLNLVRYGMLLVVVLAITITPTALYQAATVANEPINLIGIVLQTGIGAGISAVVATFIYFAYKRYLEP